MYEKCKITPGDCKDLAELVAILHHNLNDARCFVEDFVLPEDQGKRRSLVTARDGCRLVLDEVDKSLDKYSGLRKDEKRFIELRKFITRDVEGLTTKLVNHATLMQLSLTSLQRYAYSLFCVLHIDAYRVACL